MSLAELIWLVAPPLCWGCGDAVRGGGPICRRCRTELRWLDTERGRFQLVAGKDEEWMNVNPLHANDLAAAIRRMAGELRD